MKHAANGSKNHSGKQGTGKTILMILAAVLIGAASIYAVASQSNDISFRTIWSCIATMKKEWLAAAIACMMGFIVFEAAAIRQSLLLLDTGCSVRNSLAYSAADIYFSAITPSAYGGQPASAFAMVQDGISTMKATAALIMNLAMYTLSLVLIGIISFCTKPTLFLQFGLISRILIAVGSLVQVGLFAVFMLMISSERTLACLGKSIIHLLRRLYLIRTEDQYLKKLEDLIGQYQSCSQVYAAKKKELWKILLWNVLQRSSQIAVAMCVYEALGGGAMSAYALWVLQAYVVLGSNFVPVPGGMGITDYLMFNGYSSFMSVERAVKLEIVARSLSFYVCIVLCGVLLLCRAVVRFHRRKETTL